jgi:hypothetical protein
MGGRPDAKNNRSNADGCGFRSLQHAGFAGGSGQWRGGTHFGRRDHSNRKGAMAPASSAMCAPLALAFALLVKVKGNTR